MELLYEKVLDDLLANQEKLTKTERVKPFLTISFQKQSQFEISLPLSN